MLANHQQPISTIGNKVCGFQIFKTNGRSLRNALVKYLKNPDKHYILKIHFHEACG